MIKYLLTLVTIITSFSACDDNYLSDCKNEDIPTILSVKNLSVDSITLNEIIIVSPTHSFLDTIPMDDDYTINYRVNSGMNETITINSNATNNNHILFYNTDTVISNVLTYHNEDSTVQYSVINDNEICID